MSTCLAPVVHLTCVHNCSTTAKARCGCHLHSSLPCPIAKPKLTGRGYCVSCWHCCVPFSAEQKQSPRRAFPAACLCKQIENGTEEAGAAPTRANDVARSTSLTRCKHIQSSSFNARARAGANKILGTGRASRDGWWEMLRFRHR